MGQRFLVFKAVGAMINIGRCEAGLRAETQMTLDYPRHLEHCFTNLVLEYPLFCTFECFPFSKLNLIRIINSLGRVAVHVLETGKTLKCGTRDTTEPRLGNCNEGTVLENLQHRLFEH